jgi:hypothetical protein
MQFIQISQIIIPPNRQRKEFDPTALMELSNGIASSGLMHAPVLRESPEGFVLVAGERRLRAIENLTMLGDTFKFNNIIVESGFVPYVTLGQLTQLEAQEAELEENALREDLTWQDRSVAISSLHSLRSAQAQAAGRIHTVADTAVEVRGSSAGFNGAVIRKDIIIAQHMNNPEVAKAKTADEAFKILQRQETQQKNLQLAVTVGKTFSADLHKIYNENCLSWLSNAEPNQFDVILTDPPYGMGADTFGDGGAGRLANNIHQYKDDYESWVALMQEWCPLAFRVAKEKAHAYVFCDIANFPVLTNLMKAHVASMRHFCTLSKATRKQPQSTLM